MSTLSPWFTIITPVHNDVRIEKLIQSLVKDKNYKYVEHIIVTNGSTMEFVHSIKDLTGELRNCHIVSIREKGLVQALNDGIKRSRAESVVILDSDCAIIGEYLETMRLELLTHAVVRGKIVFTSSTFFSRFTCKLRDRIYNSEPDLSYAPNIAFHKDIFKRVGFFDKNVLYGFDTEYGCRLKNAGVAVHTTAKCVVTHECHPNVLAEIRVWFFYGKDRRYRYRSGCYGKRGFICWLRTLFSPNVFSLDKGVLYNVFALMFILIRGLGYVIR